MYGEYYLFFPLVATGVVLCPAEQANALYTVFSISRAVFPIDMLDLGG